MIGNILVTLALVLSVYSMIMYFFAFRGAKNTLNYARVAYHGMAMTILITSTFFLYLILTHQYQYKYVYEYSSNDLPVGFLISTFWAGQEGSFLLWLLLTAIFGIILQSYTAKRGDLEYRVMSVYTLSTSFLLVMICPLLKSPFAMIWSEHVPIVANTVNPAIMNLDYIKAAFAPILDAGGQPSFADIYPVLQANNIPFNEFVVTGKGLNPLLQNFWMQIHPPILFSGFALTSIPFAFSIAALMKNEYKDWVKQSFPWMLTAAGVLGLGIMLGGYWAYGVLGWGGYWAWDPVENSSLVPWLVCVAAIHTFLVQRKTQNKENTLGKFTRTNLILSILTYVLVIYSTFLTRSGILGNASVHSFVDQGRAVFIFLFLFILTFLGLGAGMLVYRWKSFSAEVEKDESLISRELALFTAAAVLCASAFIVIFGTSLAVVNITIPAALYSELHIPLAIIIGFLNAFSLAIRWKDSTMPEVVKKLVLSVSLSVVATLVAVFLGGVHSAIMILLFFSSVFTLIINAEIAFRVVKGNFRMVGAYVAHIGIAVFLLGVIGSAVYSKEQNVDLVRGQKTNVFGYDLTFTGYRPLETDAKKFAFSVKINDGNSERIIKPVMYQSEMNGGLMREPDILAGLAKDVYISPLGYDETDGGHSHDAKTAVLSLNDEKEIGPAKIKYLEFIPPDMSAMANGGDFQMGTKLAITVNGKTVEKSVVLKLVNRNLENVPVEIPELGLTVQVVNIEKETKAATVAITDHAQAQAAVPAEKKEVLSVAASIKPFVSFVWIGVLIMVIGFVISMIRRLRESLIISK
jgi:cytochrome c-type biogenesis protein CcmF